MTEEVVETEPEMVAAPVLKAKPASYTVVDYIDVTELKHDLAFSVNDLTTAMMQQASMFAHYGILAADAAKQVDVVEMLLENVIAAVYQKLRDEYAKAGEKITEVMLEKSVARNPRVTEMKRALNAAKRVAAIGKTAVESFRHRKDMLVQQGAQSREEMKGEVYTAARDIRQQAQEHQKEDVLRRLAERNR